MRGHQLFLSTCASLLGLVPGHGRAQDIIPPKTYTTSPTGINLADASFTYSKTDIAIGMLKLERFHVGSYDTDPNTMFFGKHTSHNFDIYVGRRVVGANDYRAIVHMGTSASGTYYEGASSISPGNRDAESGTLVKTSGNYVYTDQAGTVYAFTSSVPAAGAVTGTGSQRVSTITFPDGRVQTFSYVSGQLKLVSDTAGYAIVFEYGSNGRVSAACGFNLSQTYVTTSTSCSGAPLATSYGYSGTTLTSTTDVTNQTTSYTWGTYGITCVTPPGYSTCKIANSYLGTQVNQQTLADGSVWLFGADLAAGYTVDESTEYPNGSNNGGYVDPNGKYYGMWFTKSTPYSVTDPNGNTTEFRFMGARDYHSTTLNTPMSEGSLMTEATLPEGNKYVATYDGSNNITKQEMQAKPGSGLADLEVEFGYNYSGTPQNRAKPVWKKNAKGNQTDYAHNSWGGITSEMQPAPSSGAARPLKLYDYVQKYAYVKN
ncbi:hypothetical protein, partial [Sphingomonas sp.]|uniref:hypothetical protein n=1 Tax=Sphingomonas sp. TaxID=28214 RepID=UPI002ED89217